MTRDDYHADTSAVSHSMLNAMAQSPMHCYAKYLAPGRPAMEPTAAMRAGTLAHTLILEPETMLSRYIVRPDGLDLRTKAGREWAEYTVQPGQEIITTAALAVAEAQRKAVFALPEIAALLERAIIETPIYWTDQATGLRCRALPDARCGARVIDIKTAADVSPDAFARAVGTYGYHRQGAHYSAGVAAATGHPVEQFVMVAVSSSYPYVAVPYVLDDESEAQGFEEVAELLGRYAECQRSGVWPLYGDGVQVIGLPKWARRSMDVEVGYV